MSLRDLVFNILARDKTGQAFDSVNRKLSGLDKKVKSATQALAGAGLGASVTGPIMAFGQSTLQMAGDFEAAMNRVAGISGAVGGDLERLRETAKDLGAKTQYSAQEAAEAMEMLAQAGFSVDETIGALPGTLQLASASNVELGQTAELVGGILRGFGKPVSDLAHLNDVLVKGMNDTNAGLVDFGGAMTYVGPIASAAGLSFEETAAAIGMLSNANIKGERAGTALRGAMANILNPSNAVVDAMNAAGLSFTDAAGRMIPLVDVIRQLEPHAKDAGLFMQIFGQEAGPGMAAMVSQGSDALAVLTDDLRSANGEAERIAAINMAGYNGQVRELGGAFESLKLAVADAGLLTFMSDLVRGLTSVVRWLSEADPVILKFGTALAFAAAIIGPLVATVGLLALGIAAIGAPVAAGIAGVLAFGAAVYALWEPITAVCSFIADGFVAAWNGLAAAFDMAMNKPLEFAQKLGELVLAFNPISVAIRSLNDVFAWLFPSAMEPITKLVAGVKEWMLGKLSGIFESVKDKIKAVGDAFYDLWDRVVGHSYIPDLVDDVGDEMDRLDGEMVKPAIDANEKVGGSFRDMAKGAVGDLMQLARDGDLTLSGFFDTILSSGMKWADQMIDSVFDTVADAANNALFGSGGFNGFVTGLFGGGSSDPLSAALAAIPGLDTGGEAMAVGGRGGMDRNLVKLRLSEGEKVQVTRRGESGGGGNVTVNIQTANPAAFQASRAQVAATVTRAVALGQRGA